MITNLGMNLYELEMKLAPETPHDRDGLRAKDSVVIYVDKNMLMGNQNRLIDFVRAKPGRMMKVGDRFGEPTIRALAVYLDLANRPFICSSNYKEAEFVKTKKKRAKRDSPAEAQEEEEEEEEGNLELNKSWTYVAKSHVGEADRVMNRVEVYVETIWDASESGVKGWCFYFFMHDLSLSFDTGVGMHAAQNEKRALSRRGENAFWQWERDVPSWIKFAVSPYAHMRFTTEDDMDPIQKENARAAFALPLCDTRNPARSDRVFTFEASRDGWDETYCFAQSAAHMYFSADGQDAFVQFPKGARWIPPQLRDPRGVLFGLLERPAYALGQVSDRLESLMSLTMASEREQDQSPDALLQIVANSYKDLIQTHEDRKRPECASRFVSWVGSDSAPPGIQACWEFVRERVGTPVVPNRTIVIDDSLSPFGNAVCWEMLVFEQLLDAAYLHTELLFDYINSVGAFRAKRTLRLHTLCLGPPASGKSWKQETLVRLCAPNTTKFVGHQTKRADTTNTNRDCTLRIMDEANEAMSDKGGDGAGRAELKQILTSGVTHTEQCVVDTELKTRETIEITSHLLILLNANSNAEITAFPQSMISRLMVRYIPERRRADMIDPALRESGLGRSDLAEAEVSRHQIRHALCGLVSHAIDVGWLPEVDMEYSIMLLDDILERLKKVGVNPDARSKQRLPLYMRALTIWYAVYMVFQTNTHFKPNEPFRPEHILECARYLRCTRELTYFAVTHMYDTLINVNAPVVCKAIEELVMAQRDDKGMHPKRAKTDGKSGEYDVDWYLLHLPMMGLKDEELIAAGVKRITNAIERNDSVVYSPEMVTDTLRWMMTQRVGDTNKPAMRVTRSRFDEVGLLFSVSLIKGDVVNHVLSAVKQNMDDWVRGTSARFVTGITFREGVKAEDDIRKSDGSLFTSSRMFPQAFRVLDASKVEKANEPFVARNPAFREAGFNTLFLDEPESTNAEEPYLVLKLDLDVKQTEDRLREMGLPLELPKPEPVAKLNARYPDSIMETHEARFAKTRCSVVGATPHAPRHDAREEEEEYLFGL